MIKIKKLKKTLEKNANLILIIAIISYILIFILLSIWKYYNYYYDLLDLAIINQVFFNSAQGNLFASTIHPPSYLGDHFTPILLFLLPVYYIFQSPITLLILQSFFLGLAAWPIFLIAKNILGKTWAIFFALIFLFNPLVANINLFEFHFIPLAIFLILWAIYFYQKEKFFTFLLFIILSLLVREDVSLVIFMFGFLALLDRKKLKWIISPMLISTFYFLIALKITSLFGAAGQYKFMVYYSWLGNSWSEFFINFFLRFDKVLLHLIKIGNLEMILGLLLPFIFLPILRPKYLILSFLILIQFILGLPGGSGIVIKTHYASLFIPALIVASIYAIETFQTKKFKTKWLKFLQHEKPLAIILLVAGIIYTTITIGPFIGVVNKISSQGLVSKKSKILNEYISKVDDYSSVVASYNMLAPLSSRNNIHSLHYTYLGHLQFSKNKYIITSPVDYIVADLSDFFEYYLQYSQNPDENLIPDNFLELIHSNNLGLVEIKDGVVLYKRDAKNIFQLYHIHPQMPSIDNKKNIEINEDIEFLGYNYLPQAGT